MEKFNKKKYDMQYRKTHKVHFNVDLNFEEKDELMHLIQLNGFTSNRDFLKKCIIIMKSENNPIKKEPNS